MSENVVCHNLGYKASICHMKDYKTDPRVNYSVESDKVWKKKENNKCGPSPFYSEAKIPLVY